MFAARTPTLPPATHTNSYALGAREVLLVEPATPYDGGAARLGRLGARPRVAGAPAGRIFGDALPRRPRRRARRARASSGFPCGRTRRPSGSSPRAGRRERSPTATSSPSTGPMPESGPCSTRRGTRGATSACGRTSRARWSSATWWRAWGRFDRARRRRHARLPRAARAPRRARRALALPAHGDPIDEPTALFRRYIEHRAMREKKSLAAPRPARPRRRPDGPRTDGLQRHSGDLVADRDAELAAHLAKLVADGGARSGATKAGTRAWRTLK